MTQEWLETLLYNYAHKARDGCIVELGTYHGKGTICLARGSAEGLKAPVYTIDDFKDKTGWIGEPYRDEDKKIFKRNVKAAGLEVKLIKLDFHTASQQFNLPVALWYWDPGMRSRFWHDWIDWSRKITHGGVAIIKDTAHGDLGATAKIKLIVGTGQFYGESSRNGVTVLRRR